MAEKLGYRPELDGLRAIAAVLVVLDHALVPGFDGGGLGVDLFFALSGFLITGLLVDEWERRGKVDLVRFWWRRALRLLPAVWALVAVCWIAGPWLGQATRDGAWPTLLYFTNWQRAFRGDSGALGHTGSLAIEEQFYILWPLALIAMLAFVGRAGALRVTLTAAIGVTLVREVAHGRIPMERIYNGTDFRVDGLLYGCALALWGQQLRHRVWPIAGVVLLIGLFFARTFFAIGWIERTGIAVGTCALIAGAHLLPGLRHSLGVAPLRWLGRRSYGIYLWHYPLAATFAREADWIAAALLVASTTIIAAASYRWIEEPCLRLKRSSELEHPVDDDLIGSGPGPRHPGVDAGRAGIGIDREARTRWSKNTLGGPARGARRVEQVGGEYLSDIGADAREAARQAKYPASSAVGGG
jgi:peptidoglycan/LPS O-acetylase OafA/YrhL